MCMYLNNGNTTVFIFVINVDNYAF